MRRTIRLNSRELGKIREKVKSALGADALKGSGLTGKENTSTNLGLGTVLRSQAVRRIHAGRDSEHVYPDLWVNRQGITESYRHGGSPLQDTGMLMASLHSQTTVAGNKISMRLMDGSPGGYGVYHQHGFTTTGPNFIPLSHKGRKKQGKLKYGKDYIVAKKGVTVPQRKIFNLPPEDRKEIGAAIVNAITNMR